MLSQSNVAKDLSQIATDLKNHLASPEYATGMLTSLSQVSYFHLDESIKLRTKPERRSGTTAALFQLQSEADKLRHVAKSDLECFLKILTNMVRGAYFHPSS